MPHQPHHSVFQLTQGEVRTSGAACRFRSFQILSNSCPSCLRRPVLITPLFWRVRLRAPDTPPSSDALSQGGGALTVVGVLPYKTELAFRVGDDAVRSLTFS